MRFKELTNAEQAKVRRLLKDQLTLVDVQPFPHVRQMLAEPSGSGLEPEVLDEIRRMWKSLETAWSSDFELSAWLARRVEGDRTRYLTGAEELGVVSGDTEERSHLTRRIHHQRLELRVLQRMLVNLWRGRMRERDVLNTWLARQLSLPEEAAEEVDPVLLRKRIRMLKQDFHHAERIIELQQDEMRELLDRVVRQAATG